MITKKQKQDIFEGKITPRHLVLCIFFIVFAAGLLTLGEYPAWSEDDPYDMLPSFMKPDHRIWKGTITITRTGHGDEHVDKSSGGNIKRSEYSRNVNEKMTLEVCGPTYDLYVLRMTHTLTDHTKSSSEVVEANRNCGMPEEAKEHTPLYQIKHYDHDIKTPGNSKKKNSKKTATLYSGKGATEMKKYAGATIKWMPGNKYVISASHKWYTTHTEDSVESKTYVCKEKTLTRKTNFRTCPLGQKGSIQTSGSPGDDCITFTTIMPPRPHTFGFVDNKTADRSSDTISDTYTSQNDQGIYKEKTVATWNLKAQDPCQDVFDALQGALGAAEAYADQDIRARADNVEEYEGLITKKYGGGDHQQDDGGPPPLPDYEMWVKQKNCKIVNREAFKEQQKKECKHPIIFKATLLHEQQHVDQCQGNHEKFNSDFGTKAGVQALAQAEVSAYLAEAKKLLGWLRTYCSDKNLDLDGSETRIEFIEAMDAGW
ncbi:MAG: hypothetical protein K9J85_09265 [Desulfobacteraceae bacterium]|nr:hypothetical protein [Desulfobacteraceae bacterium]